jgi:hypothetical protein
VYLKNPDRGIAKKNDARLMAAYKVSFALFSCFLALIALSSIGEHA